MHYLSKFHTPIFMEKSANYKKTCKITQKAKSLRFMCTCVYVVMYFSVTSFADLSLAHLGQKFFSHP